MHLPSGEGKGQEGWEVQAGMPGRISQGKLLCLSRLNLGFLCEDCRLPTVHPVARFRRL